MSIWGKLAGAAAGLAIGGPIGALLGGVAGHYVIDRDKEEDGPAENQVAFTVGVIALSAKMAKADGIVTQDEVHAFQEDIRPPSLKEAGCFLATIWRSRTPPASRSHAERMARPVRIGDS